ncbi:ATP-binding cassette domain-containing protein [Flammeovirga yaeyamensis]|uniref:ATP-binding cassette domain-containing protein n=1 Tax=Flammeovirga yaeyamensis TaxID=367791 RepID=A0AAX1NEL6_9BACT|nr:ABC transporter ATP-binding protein [Flammeovirga yaeyamensis]MBB3699299.1 putative ABC transport system ATP-binding protein [Flammeovirga yaeyamensis]NMF35438.1 ABC transporter ATP-binding protein [Flammeovirga yaeyamensis]QWG04298.1 ATP-binding cassette domain-containing protein [Flammeovirga yaeyamensis]
METNNLIELNNVTKKFLVGDGEFTALSNINLQFSKGEFSGLIGPSGSGKTTLLNLIGALDDTSEGSIEINGKNIANNSDEDSALLRNEHIGFIFQSYNLLPVYSIYENVEFPLLLQKLPKAQRKEMVMQALKWVGLEDIADKKTSQISGGQAQRVAIARSIVKKPQIILADEPTANLDSANAYKVMDILKKLNEELGITFIFSSHDSKVIKYLKRVISLEDGKVVNDEKK